MTHQRGLAHDFERGEVVSGTDTRPSRDDGGREGIERRGEGCCDRSSFSLLDDDIGSSKLKVESEDAEDIDRISRRA